MVRDRPPSVDPARRRALNEQFRALDDRVRGIVHERANALEAEYRRRGGPPTAHLEFLEQALVEQTTAQRDELDVATENVVRGLGATVEEEQ